MEYENIRRQQIQDLQDKRQEIMRKNIEKQQTDQQRLLDRKRKVQQEKEKRNQQAEQILKEQREEKERQKREFFANIKNKGKQQTVRNTPAMTETQGGVQFELVGVPECMDEAQQTQPAAARQTLGDVMVFDMSKPAAAKPKLGAARSGKKPAAAPKTGDAVGDGFGAVMVSDKDGERIQSRHIDQSLAEFSGYRAMIDKVLGSDDDLRNKGNKRGGELVRIDTEIDPSKGDTGKTNPASQIPVAIGQSASTDDNASSDYENDQFDVEEYNQMMYE